MEQRIKQLEQRVVNLEKQVVAATTTKENQIETLLMEILSELKRANEYIVYKANEELGKIEMYKRLPDPSFGMNFIKNYKMHTSKSFGDLDSPFTPEAAAKLGWHKTQNDTKESK